MLYEWRDAKMLLNHLDALRIDDAFKKNEKKKKNNQVRFRLKHFNSLTNHSDLSFRTISPASLLHRDLTTSSIMYFPSLESHLLDLINKKRFEKGLR